jgi:hypothetical protein
MKLFAISRKEEYEALNRAYYLAGFNGYKFNIDGIYENSTWRFYNPSSGSVYSKAVPINASGGNCMQLFGNVSVIGIQSVACSTTSYVICEWFKDPKWE